MNMQINIFMRTVLAAAKGKIKSFCNKNNILQKAILVPYSNFCERRRVHRADDACYHLKNPIVCLHNIYRKPGVNFWFLLEQGHNNIGDIAIGIAEKRFFDKYFPAAEKHFIYEAVFARYQRKICHQIQPGDVIILRGGGSIGNTVRHEQHREEIIRKFKRHLIISMPQTMCFADTKKGEREKARAAKIYSKNKNLLLIAREEKSYFDMKKTFPGTNILLTPDIVMTMDFHLPQLSRNGILLCFRSDWEKNLSVESIQRIEQACHALTNAIQYTDMYAGDEFIPLEKRNEVFFEKINQFKRSSLVITDRLHGMVFSAISGTPCVALSNYNHKVRETYKWLKRFPYIHFCNTVDEAIRVIPQYYGLQGTVYSTSFTEEYFVEVVSQINSYLA